jgi:hypothetical protein
VSIARDIARMIDPSLFALDCGLEAEPWQAEWMRSRPRKSLLSCSRQSGKSTTAGLVALETAVTIPGSVTLIGGPSQRQSNEFVRTIKGLHGKLSKNDSETPRLVGDSVQRIELENKSRVIGLSGDPDTARGIASVQCLILDEVGFIPDALEILTALAPMQAGVTDPRTILLSTPNGDLNAWHDLWHNGDASWHRVEVPWWKSKRLSADPQFIADQRQLLGERKFSQEFCLAWLPSEDAAFGSEGIDAMFDPSMKGLNLL